MILNINDINIDKNITYDIDETINQFIILILIINFHQ